MYLWEEGPSNKIDSASTINGNFKISHKWTQNKEPVFLGIYHIDKNGVKRLFDFTTNAKYKGVPGWSVNVFYSDPVIIINGNFEMDSPIKGYILPPNIKNVKGPTLKAGKQTEAFYNVDGDLFEKIDDKTIQIISEKIKKYPFSYSLLYSIVENKNNFSAQQVQVFLKLFQGEITKSESYKKLLVYNQKRLTKNAIPLSALEDINGKKSEILNKKFTKHLIVFWASWCGPCRAEIPLLKKAYTSKNPKTEFISISIDTDKIAWIKAANEEKMSWKQFILDKNTPAYENFQIRLKLNSAIPYSVLVDNNLKILASSVGLSSLDELQKLVNKN